MIRSCTVDSSVLAGISAPAWTERAAQCLRRKYSSGTMHDAEYTSSTMSGISSRRPYAIAGTLASCEGLLGLGYSLAHGSLDPGKQSLWHRLKSSEVYYFIAGRGVMSIEEESTSNRLGDLCAAGHEAVIIEYGTNRWSFSAWSIRPGPRRMRQSLNSREEMER